jgi:hypothetical protein
MSTIITTVAMGGWYPHGVARLIERFHAVSPGYTIRAYVNVAPVAVPTAIVDGYDYTPYLCKPFALSEAMQEGCTIAILLDAAFYPIRDIAPLVDHVARTGYFLCRNGNNLGEWSSDRSLEAMGVSREDAFGIEEISSYCVGLNFRDPKARELLYHWTRYALDPRIFPGPHTNEGHEGRNRGFVSSDRRVKGHRHDQTALSVIANRLGMDDLVSRPRFTAYLGSETAETVLVNQGMGS